jgi:replication-associated recombination protein RarA
MPKHPHAFRPGHRRDRNICFRVSDHDYRRLLERAEKAGASTPSAYLRAAALTGREFRLPAYETLRDLRNEVIRLATAIKTTGSVRAMEAAISALDRISKL